MPNGLARPLAAEPRGGRHRRLASRHDEARPVRQARLRALGVDHQHHRGRGVRDAGEICGHGGRGGGEQPRRLVGRGGEHDRIGLDRVAPVERDPSRLDGRHRRTRSHAAGQTGGELVGQPLYAAAGSHEHGAELRPARQLRRRLRPAEEAPLRPFPRHEVRERRLHAQPVDVAGVEAGEQRAHREVGRLVAEPPPQQRTERLVAVALAGLPHEILGGAALPGRGQTRPPEEVADVAGDAERRVLQQRHEAGVGPQVRARRPRDLELDAELPAELDRPRLTSEERVGAGRQRQVADVDAAELAAGPRTGLQDRDVDRWVGLREAVRDGEARDPAADDHDPPSTRRAHPTGTCAMWSRTTWASTSRYSGSALGMRVRANVTPASSAICFASMSRS